MEDAQIQVYTGEGKGKTTASLGLAIRALGRDKKVITIYFDKGGDHYGERKILDELKSDKFNYLVTGLERFDSKTKKFRFGVIDRDVTEAKRGLELITNEFKKNSYHIFYIFF